MSENNMHNVTKPDDGREDAVFELASNKNSIDSYITRLEDSIHNTEYPSDIIREIIADESISPSDVSVIIETVIQDAIDQDNPQAAADIISIFANENDNNMLDTINEFRDSVTAEPSTMEELDQHLLENIEIMVDPIDSSTYMEVGAVTLEIDPEGNVIDIDTGYELMDILPEGKFAVSDATVEDISVETTQNISQLFDPLERFLDDVSQELKDAGMSDVDRQEFVENHISEIDQGLKDGSITQDDTGDYVDKGLEWMNHPSEIDTGVEIPETIPDDMEPDLPDVDDVSEQDLTTQEIEDVEIPEPDFFEFDEDDDMEVGEIE